MSYIVIENFKLGMDRRRSIYSARPGSLWTLINAHLTRGGEIEKRKAFTFIGSLPVDSIGVGIPDTYGLQGDGNNLTVFGNLNASIVTPALPPGVRYQQLTHPKIRKMTRVLSGDFFNGKLYVVAQYDDGSIIQFYDGVAVNALFDGLSGVGYQQTTANFVAVLLTPDKTVSTSTFTTSTATVTPITGSGIYLTGVVPGVKFIVDLYIEKANGREDKTSYSITEITTAVIGDDDVQGTATFQVTGGNPLDNSDPQNIIPASKLSKVFVDGIDILGVPVDWVTSNSNTMQLIVNQINGYTAAPIDYTAALASGTITISAAAGAGATVNGHTVSFSVSNGLTMTSNTVISGGVSSATSVAQRTKILFPDDATFALGDKLTITIDGIDYGAHGNTNIDSTQVLTNESKVYTVSGSLLRFSAVNEAVKWSPNAIGAGFINLSNHIGGNERLTGLDVYLGNLAIFSRRSVQVWHVEADDKNNNKLQILKNTGTRSPNSITTYGDVDLFYLADSGVRSLRARDSSNTAYANDVGTSIDAEIIEFMKTLTDAEIESAIGVISTQDDRYWLAIKDRIYVLSYFPGSKVSAWSYYEPGFVIDDMVIQNNKLYLRSGNAIYLYGGNNGDSYDSSTVTVQLPYLDGGKPGTYKQLQGIDIGSEGIWNVKILINPRDVNQSVTIGDLDGVTYSEPDAAVIGHATHMAPLLTNTQPGYAKLANMALYYQSAESEA